MYAFQSVSIYDICMYVLYSGTSIYSYLVLNGVFVLCASFCNCVPFKCLLVFPLFAILIVYVGISALFAWHCAIDFAHFMSISQAIKPNGGAYAGND